eukprot:10550395-Karenia_brevis.AAC.1
MFSTLEHDGYSVSAYDSFLYMVALVLSNGWQTDPLERPGIEPLQVKLKAPEDMPYRQFMKYTDGETEVQQCPNIAINSVAFVKGRKRTYAALAIVAAIKEIGVNIQEEWPALWQSLRTTHMVVTCYSDPQQEFAAAAACNSQ